MRERRIIKAQEQYEEKPGPLLLIWPISEVKSSQSTQVEITQRHHWRRCHEKETEPDLYPGKIWIVRRYGEHKVLDKKKEIKLNFYVSLFVQQFNHYNLPLSWNDCVRFLGQWMKCWPGNEGIPEHQGAWLWKTCTVPDRTWLFWSCCGLCPQPAPCGRRWQCPRRGAKPSTPLRNFPGLFLRESQVGQISTFACKCQMFWSDRGTTTTAYSHNWRSVIPPVGVQLWSENDEWPRRKIFAWSFKEFGAFFSVLHYYSGTSHPH